jgi:hypothetical protein
MTGIGLFFGTSHESVPTLLDRVFTLSLGFFLGYTVCLSVTGLWVRDRSALEPSGIPPATPSGGLPPSAGSA